MYEAIAAVITFVISTYGLDFVRRYFYMDLTVGPTAAICIMGALILWAVRHSKSN